jgi:hypothetical protein
VEVGIIKITSTTKQMKKKEGINHSEYVISKDNGVWLLDLNDI